MRLEINSCAVCPMSYRHGEERICRAAPDTSTGKLPDSDAASVPTWCLLRREEITIVGSDRLRWGYSLPVQHSNPDLPLALRLRRRRTQEAS